ncbi:MAG: ATP-binding protein, partial [Maricaulaceae bacterium]
MDAVPAAHNRRSRFSIATLLAILVVVTATTASLASAGLLVAGARYLASVEQELELGAGSEERVAPGLAPSLARDTPLFIALAIGASVALAGSLGALFARGVASPFERAARAIRIENAGEPIDESGPTELAAVIERLNDIEALVHKYESEKARLADEVHAARALASASDTAKTRFLAHMSHELRTPLNAIMGYTKFVAEDLVGEEHEQSRDDLARVQRASNHLLNLINQVLDLSKVEAGSLTLDLAGFDVGAIVREVVETSAPLADKNRTTLTLHEAPGGEVIVSDSMRLRQCLLNVVGNALKFTEDGRVDVWARLEKTEASRRLVCRVKDTGPGIPADRVEAIFEPFVQVESEHGQSGKGTGLGLAITKRLCQEMGGDIECKSVLGKGSTFTITVE